MNNDDKIVIYALIDPRNNTVKYIGWTTKTLDKRLKGHLSDARRGFKNHRCNWIRYLLANNLYPLINLVEETFYEKREERERYWIKFYGRETLTNSTDGGEGSVGFKFSEESKQLLSKIRTGRKLSAIHIEGIRKGKLGEKNPNYKGKATTKESLAKTRVKVLGVQRKNHSKKLQGKKRTGSSIYVGVAKRTRKDGKIKWDAHIMFEKRTIYIGTFYEEIEAAKAYDRKALELYGINAKTNFPKENYL